MVFIRADANEIIGTGHVMRCISIANGFRDAGEKVLFITADHRGDELIRNAGFYSRCIESQWDDMESEIPIMKELLESEPPKHLIVDSYYVTKDYLKSVTSHTRTVYMDDMNAQVWDVDYLINYNIYADSMDYSAYYGLNARLMLGPKYAPLRKEFHSLGSHTINRDIRNILVSAGGADPEGLSVQIAREICPKYSDMRFHFVVGALNPRMSEIKKLERDNIILHINERNMAKLMQDCDIAISAAGTTLYELCASGIPTITYTLADNQLVAAEQFGKRGIMVNAGDCRNNNEFMTSLQRCLDDLVCNKERRNKMSKKMTSLVDGNGAMNIVKVLMEDAGNNAN